MRTILLTESSNYRTNELTFVRGEPRVAVAASASDPAIRTLSDVHPIYLGVFTAAA